MTRPAENLTRAQAQQRARVLADLTYQVRLDLRSTDDFHSRTVIQFACPEPGAETFVDVTAQRIDRAELNGEVIDVAGFDGVRLTLPPLGQHNELVIEAVHAYSKEGTGMHAFVDPVDQRRYLHTQSEPNHAHHYFACFDQPDLKATFAFTVTVPTDWVVVSNAPPDGAPRADGDAATWTFQRTAVMPPYITAIVAGPYHVERARHGDIDLGLYCRRTLAPHLDADEIFEITRQGFDLFPKLFDTPYVWGKYDQAFVPEFSSGAMENAACVTFNEAYVFRSRVTEADRLSRAETILHELAHMWFGDLVTMRWWDDLWLNESFATYTSFHAMQIATRFSNAWVHFNDELKSWATYQDQMPTTHPIEADLPDVASVHQNFDGITYAKGASVLRQLAAWVGEDAFFAGCASYFETHAYGNATLRDFLAALEKASGRDLEPWADTWLRTAGVNTIGVQTSDDGQVYETAVVRQTASEDHPTLRPHRLAIGLYRVRGGVLACEGRVELDVTGAETEVPALVGSRVADLVLPNDGDLTYAKLALDAGSLRTLTEHLHALDDPLARTLCWGAVWDLVRDGELAPGWYADLVIGNAHGEADIGVLRTLLSRARTAAELYGDPANRTAQMARLHEHAARGRDAAGPGTDHQLGWTRHWASTARTPEQADDVRRLLASETSLDGLVIDTELRWHLIGALVHADAAGDDVVAQQLEADPTDLGQRHAAAIRASRPSPEAKSDAWRQVVESHDLSHTQVDAIARGMRQHDQTELLVPYVDPYFDVLPHLWRDHSTERAIVLTQLLYPLAVVDDHTLARTDAAIASALPPACIRELRELRDTLVRARRARERDRAGTSRSEWS
ncbi:MAG TPA: aminopeptidase N [Nitriliruptorales bacterium]